VFVRLLSVPWTVVSVSVTVALVMMQKFCESFGPES